MATTTTATRDLFAAVDMGTNTFKLLIVRADPTTGRFLPLDRVKYPVVLGRNNHQHHLISTASQSTAISALKNFQKVLRSWKVSPHRTRFVATSAVREALNQSDFLHTVRQSTGLNVDVLTGEEEARLTYIGVLQYLPLYNKTILNIDIGGGSTEFVIGRQGQVRFATSLKLGHVTLTDQFVKIDKISDMRQHIGKVIHESGLIEKINELGFDEVTGSSGTIIAIERAVSSYYGGELIDDVRVLEGCKRDGRFSRGELGDLVERLMSSEEEEKIHREKFFKRRSEFIVAGTVLLEEILGMLGIGEIEVSGYSLGEGVVAEKLAAEYDGYDLSANARWGSVVGVATRFNKKKAMKAAASCSRIAKEIFEGLRKWNEFGDGQNKLPVSLDDKDLEYLEAACLLHSIGMFTRKKGYHKMSYHIIVSGDHLQGYSPNEIEIVALLVKHHRKKFPKLGHRSLEGFTNELKQKFRILCAVLRVSILVQRDMLISSQDMELVHSDDGFNLVLGERRDPRLVPDNAQPAAESSEEDELTKELENFRLVCQQNLVVVRPSTVNSPER